jgi:prepilin-type N-terminal cleavage/methylation domain-containing protein
MEKINKKREGFTLVELLVVIAIIGLLSTLSVVALSNARQKSRDAKRVADIKQTQTALELYYSDNSKYPPTLTFNGGSIASSGITYMGKVPGNPIPRNDGAGVSKCPDSEYHYVATPAPTYSTYSIWYCIGGATGGLSAGTNCASPAGLSDGTGLSCLP